MHECLAASSDIARKEICSDVVLIDALYLLREWIGITQVVVHARNAQDYGGNLATFRMNNFFSGDFRLGIRPLGIQWRIFVDAFPRRRWCMHQIRTGKNKL